jgi:hypothetical protein
MPSAASLSPRRLSIGVLWVFITFFGVWTLVYQLALVVRMDSRLTLVVTLLCWAPAMWWVSRRGRREMTGPDAGSPWLGPVHPVGVLAALSVAAAVWVLAVADLRVAALVVGLLAGAGALWLTRRRRGSAPAQPPPVADTPFWVVAWALGLASALLSSLLARPDGDDAYFLNFSVWVSERHSFPLRDTMISQEVFPAIEGHSPPVHSIEGLLGTIAAFVGLPAGTMTYLIASPVLIVIAVLALAALVDHLRIRAPEVALTTAVVVLWLSGSGASFGTFFALRMWQGKGVLLMVALPLVLLAGMRLLDRPNLLDGVVYVAAVVGSIGASNSAVFLTPLLIGALALVAALLARWRAALMLALPMTYPLVVGLVVLLTAPLAPTDGQLLAVGLAPAGTDFLDPLGAVPGVQGQLMIFVAALCIGWLGTRSLPGRAALLASSLIAGVMVLPPVVQVLGERLGIESVAWRFWWIVPFPLLIAGVVGVVAGVAPERGIRTRYGLGLVGAGLVVVPMVLGANWVGHSDNGARRVLPTTWKVPPGALAGAVLARDVSEPGDTVLAPWHVSRVLAGLTVSVQPVSARAYYLSSYATSPEARVAERVVLQRFADEATPEVGSLDDALDVVGVDTACVPTERGAAVDLLEAAGFAVVGSTDSLTCMRR